MTRVVPSQVVDFIDSIGSFSGPMDHSRMEQIDFAELSALLTLIDEIPGELLILDHKRYRTLLSGKARVFAAVQKFSLTGKSGPYIDPYLYKSISGIREALVLCPDQGPAPTTSELRFIPDVDLREALRNDVGAIERGLSNGEWKTATVLAGSVIEALLLWKVQQRSDSDRASAITHLRAKGILTRIPDVNLERWDLHEFAEIAAELGIIKTDTLTEVRLAREFRNLIHPGRSQRLAQKCDRGTALSSVAALEHVVRDLA